jgi:hypothetical protein
MTELGDLDKTALATVRTVLLRLAHDYDEQAADEAARTPYWAPSPGSVTGSRLAAQALRASADSLLAAS